jgi:hypothetical protein
VSVTVSHWVLLMVSEHVFHLIYAYNLFVH